MSKFTDFGDYGQVKFSWIVDPENDTLMKNIDGETYFYRVTLVTPLGEFKVGRKFETAVLNSESSQLHLYDGDTRHTFDLTLTAYFTSSRKIPKIGVDASHGRLYTTLNS